MQCPTDGTTLTIADRTGIEIDYCPQCRGVWLDRGELDKIIERSAADDRPARTEQSYRAHPGYPPPRRNDDDDDWDRSPGQRKRKRGMLGDLFDF